MVSTTNDNAIIYATYVTLYANDIACNAINDIKPFINRKDKKALKTWRELDERVSRYIVNYSRIARMEGLYFLANYNEVIDECADKPLSQIETAVKYCLKRNGVEDDGLIHKTITAHILIEFATTTIEYLCEQLKANGLPYKPLLKWRLIKTRNAMKLFYLKVCKSINNEVIKEIQSIIAPIISLLTGAIADYKNFERAYEYAVKEEKRQYDERNNNN